MMPSVSELAREQAEEAALASPFTHALRLALAGEPIPRSLLIALADEGGDFVTLINAIIRHRRG
jgi:hypothetical protein